MDTKIIAVIGAPGVGKSFLVQKLIKKLNASSILEEAEKLPERILENFRKDIRHMETILWFRNKCIDDIKKAQELKKKGKTVVMDTCLLSNELHITTLTMGFERQILLKQAKEDRKFIPQPDVLVCLDASESKIKELTMKRGRDFDTTEKFLKRNFSIRKAHSDYYKKSKNKIVYINRDNLDFSNDRDLQKVIDKIKTFHQKN